MSRCIYISRNGKGNRAVRNERQVADRYRSYGFLIATPGSEGPWTFEEEVAHYNSAYILAGFEGTNMHNSVFMKPGRTLIRMKIDGGTRNGRHVVQPMLEDMNSLTAHQIDLTENMTGARLNID